MTELRYNSLMSKRWKILIFCAVLGVVVLFSPLFRMEPGETYGIASWFKTEMDRFLPGVACATNRWPKGTTLKVTNIQNGRYVICRVITQGPPMKWGRIIDLSQSTFSRIADPKQGIVWVRIKPIYKNKN